ncbi:sensor histidine kinase [Candidatus Bipolaricaulota bacterium]|nr:sensor histidine kinase [Candidatus Bipolaricaulota bacterium]
MIEDLDMHLLDLVQNALSAHSTRVDVRVICEEAADRLIMSVADNGAGMDERTLETVQRGYYSSKSEQSVGLGIPLLRETAQHCDGRFDIASKVGAGTTVTAEFRRSHIDLPPFGDLAATFLNIVATADTCSIGIAYQCDGNELELDTAALSELLGDVSFQHPEVIRFLQAYIAERVNTAG